LIHSEGNKQIRILTREIFGNATECKIDRLGRIIIPEYLIFKIFKNYDPEIVLLGLVNKVEI
jgi:DNA-binding transcriptional regulator/RsmH inhibitor MraZ